MTDVKQTVHKNEVFYFHPSFMQYSNCNKLLSKETFSTLEAKALQQNTTSMNAKISPCFEVQTIDF